MTHTQDVEQVADLAAGVTTAARLLLRPHGEQTHDDRQIAQCLADLGMTVAILGEMVDNLHRGSDPGLAARAVQGSAR